MMMKKTYLFAAMALTAITAQAQEVAATGDAYMAAQLATEDLNGTARYVGMGGAMDALGADISVIGTNPAGIGLFRKGQISASFGLNSQADGKRFADGSKTNASFDQLGVVFSTRTGQSSYMNFAFNYRKSRNFDYVLSAAGRLSTVTADGTRNYLGAQNSQTVYKAVNGLFRNNYSLAYSQLDALYMLNMNDDGEDVYDYGFDGYEFDRAHTGYIGNYEFNLSGNVNNRFYWGLTVGVSDVHYKGYSEYHEYMDADNNGRDDAYGVFNSDVHISDNHKISGHGYSVKAGIIFRPVEESPFRIGASVSTPTFYKLTTDNYTTISLFDDHTTTPAVTDYSAAGEDFRFNTPWKFSLSAGHTIGSNVALGAVYEYADYSTCDMRTIDGYDPYYDQDESSSDPAMERLMEKSLKGVSTLKLGAEYKPDKNVALRVGYNYVSSVYQQDAVRDQTVESPGVYYASTTDYTNWGDTHRLTLGAGFTFDKFRFDLAYQYQTREGDFYPFMKNYSTSFYEQGTNGVETGNIITMTNQCNPVKVKDNRHQLICSLTYTL